MKEGFKPANDNHFESPKEDLGPDAERFLSDMETEEYARRTHSLDLAVYRRLQNFGEYYPNLLRQEKLAKKQLENNEDPRTSIRLGDRLYEIGMLIQGAILIQRMKTNKEPIKEDLAREFFERYDSLIKELAQEAA